VALFANHTSTTPYGHVLDVLLAGQVKVVRIFGPEHGFRGTADAGAKVGNEVDGKTGLPIVSLYGKKRKPGKEELDDVDVVVFDIQDLGCRFYTYISSLQEVMEGCFALNKKVMVLDRPNPNGGYVDGPILDTNYRSFVGMQPVPVVYGMTMGEYGAMLIGQGWLRLPKRNYKPLFQVVRNKDYFHRSEYVLPEKPSPNIPDNSIVYLYPGTCFFEGTILSEGRGTPHPFAWVGHPNLPNTGFQFTPVAIAGAVKPKLKDQLCNGYNLYDSNYRRVQKMIGNQLFLKPLLDAYKAFPGKDSFFLKPSGGGQYFFDKLAGSNQLRKQMVAGKSEAEIRRSWAPGLAAFRKIRAKYLLYP
jgi:uncharacterized protein YbbC (DUF1343 family)